MLTLTTLVTWIGCSLLELQRLNAELEKRNEAEDQELERLRKALDDAVTANKVSTAKLRSLEGRIADVRCYTYTVATRK